MKPLTCKTLGITGTDADTVMGNADFIRLCELREKNAAYALAFNILNPGFAPSTEPAPEKTEHERLKLRERDRIEGDEVVLVFRSGREVRVPKDAWTRLADRNFEPHAIVASLPGEKSFYKL